MFFLRSFALIFILVVFNTPAIATDNTWSAAYGDAVWDAASDIYIDYRDDYVYLVGTFEGTLDLGGEVLVSAGNEDIFLAKFDRKGNHLWSRSFGNEDPQWGEAIAFNQAGGIVIGGQFQGVVDFGGGPLSAPYQSIFVASFNPDGDHQWSDRYGSWGNNRLEDLDSSMMIGEVFIVCTGSFAASGLNFGGGDLPYQGATDAFIVEFDVNGNHRFSESYGDAAAQAGKAITAYVHSYAPSYVVTGEFAGSIDFGDGAMTASEGSDVFTAAFLPSATLRWARQYGGPGDDTGSCVAHDPEGNLFVGGQNEANGVPVAYVSKYDSDGNAIRTLLAYQTSGTESEMTGLAISDDGDVLMAGSFEGEIHFFPRGLQLFSYEAGDQDIYVARWDNELITPIFEYGLGGDLTQSAAAIDYTEYGAVLTGWFEGAIDFGCGLETSAGEADAFMARFSGNFPVIVAIEDIGDDQGRQVRLELVRSDYDRPGSADPITQYEIFRRIDQQDGNASLGENPDVEMASSLPSLSGVWDYLGAIPAHGDPRYAMVVPTLADSSISGGMRWTTFFVRAATADPYTFYDSDPDSGYSVDNIAPAVPTGLAMNPDWVLSWNASPEPDFQFFSVYGSSVDQLDETAVLLGHTIETSLDVAGTSFNYYLVTASDHAGNQSEAAVLGGASVVPEAGQKRFALLPCVPNPFNPSTVIKYHLPGPTSVYLQVFDPSGRLIETLVAGERKSTGYHEVIWTGRDATGRRVAAGTYLYRLEAGAFSRTRRMTLVK